MVTRTEGKYAKTDFDFSTARSVVRGVYIIFMVLVVLGALGGFLLIVSGADGAAGIATLVSALVCGLLLHIGYSFLIGFFELIKHAREIRNELVALRVKSGIATSATVASAQPTANAGETRYDAATHQYVKA